MDNLTPINSNYSLFDPLGSVNLTINKGLLGISGGPSTYLFNGNLSLNSIRASAGLVILSEQLAIEKVTEVNAFFAKSIRLAENQFLSVSLNTGVKNYVANFTSLDPADPSFKQDTRQTIPNFGFGLMLYTDWYYLGVSIPELTITHIGSASVQNNTNFHNHYFITGALITKLGKDFHFKPSLLYSYTQGVPASTDISGTFLWKDVLELGIDYSTLKQIASIISFNIDKIQVGYSYRVSTQSVNIGGLGSGTNEFSMGYRFGKNIPKSRLL